MIEEFIIKEEYCEIRVIPISRINQKAYIAICVRGDEKFTHIGGMVVPVIFVKTDSGASMRYIPKAIEYCPIHQEIQFINRIASGNTEAGYVYKASKYYNCKMCMTTGPKIVDIFRNTPITRVKGASTAYALKCIDLVNTHKNIIKASNGGYDYINISAFDKIKVE